MRTKAEKAELPRTRLGVGIEDEPNPAKVDSIRLQLSEQSPLTTALELTTTPLSIPRPAADEAAPFYHGYIAEVSGENLGEQLVDQLAEVERLFGALDDTAALASGLPSTSWSKVGQASGKPVSARALAYIMVGHVAHHLGVLRERYGLGARAATASFAQNR